MVRILRELYMLIYLSRFVHCQNIQKAQPTQSLNINSSLMVAFNYLWREPCMCVRVLTDILLFSLVVIYVGVRNKNMIVDELKKKIY